VVSNSVEKQTSRKLFSVANTQCFETNKIFCNIVRHISELFVSNDHEMVKKFNYN